VFDSVTNFADQLILEITHLSCWPEGTILTFRWNVKGLIAVFCVCLICGTMGALVVGNRMAFFSDALAHCAFAGVALGIAMFLIFGSDERVFYEQVTGIMVTFGALIGLMIAFVRERTGLASDTVIGVFYAAAVGLGAIFMGMIHGRNLLDVEKFIFGDPVTAETGQVLCLCLLAAGVVVFVGLFYNRLILVSTSTSLALSRRVPVRLCQYSFIVALALMVNLSLVVVGALLINGMLIVPAAAAANLARNLRQMFWYSLAIALASGVGGYLLSYEISVRRYPKPGIGTAGAIVVLAVVLFVASMLFGRLLRDRRPAEEPPDEPADAGTGTASGV
jgi:zinc transport system permease protein